MKNQPVRFSADGIVGTTIQEAKFIENPRRSPYIFGSKAPDFLREKIFEEVDNEFRRMKLLIDDLSNPLADVEVNINNPDAKMYFVDMLRRHGLNGRVIVR